MKILIFLPISRAERVKDHIEMVESIETRHDLQILAIVDNLRITSIDSKLPLRFVSMRRKSCPAIDVHQRRKRIADIFNEAKRLIPEKIDFILTIEDDTLIEPDYLERLIELYEVKSRINRVGFVSGVQVGRWGYRMLGVWKKDKENAWTLPYLRDEVVKVDACGFYCYLTTPEVFKKVEYRSGQFGPDVNWGFDISERGYFNYCDMSLGCGHIQPNSAILLPENSEIVELNYKLEK